MLAQRQGVTVVIFEPTDLVAIGRGPDATLVLAGEAIFFKGEKYPVGTDIRIVDIERLQAFRRDWKYHHPISDQQVQFAGSLLQSKGRRPLSWGRGPVRS